ncbi:hypothetical protein AcV7_006043 [Taiwanofungus camphoratus]|nr:hypothetical protein AcV7_006043 [Antrodia cinnamomea]
MEITQTLMNTVFLALRIGRISQVTFNYRAVGMLKHDEGRSADMIPRFLGQAPDALYFVKWCSSSQVSVSRYLSLNG